MARVYDNWERLVRATLKREQIRNAGQGHERVSSGLAGAVPPSLGRANINAILQAADEIQDENPNVARILCEQAYSMAQDLDPNSDGRGVLQFKTGLMSVIKQKLAKRDGAPIDRNRDIERLWDFYLAYKKRHKVDDIQQYEQRLRESGAFSANIEQILEMRKVFTTLRALVEVMEALSKDADPDRVGRLIKEETQYPLIFAISRDKNMLINKAFDDENGSDWNIVVNRNLQDLEVEEYENLLQFLSPSGSTTMRIS
ncbi:callose synthase 10-like [Carica papaya]|uniref:callose synthase 10-like n=1 Tax=Carica papaya TaxID=3649 RepID=UPI000B8C6E0E|nr:callose synthase 10-like [Carica papaya]